VCRLLIDMEEEVKAEKQERLDNQQELTMGEIGCRVPIPNIHEYVSVAFSFKFRLI
jgi:hypothetical protein